MHVKASIRALQVGAALILALLVIPESQGQAKRTVISLEPIRAGASEAPGSASLLDERPNYRDLGSACVGERADLKELTLRFEQTAKLGQIGSSAEFAVEEGGSCLQGNSYNAGNTCTLLVRFTPRGPGRRSGTVTISHDRGEPLSLGLVGNGYAPVVSFTPALISTVPASFASDAGLISQATNLAVDDGDTLYVADTGNNVVRSLDSSGTFMTVPTIFGITAPVGVAVDDLGSVYITQDSPAALIESQFNSASFYESGSGTCAVGATCALYQQALDAPGELAFDHSGGIFMGMPGAPAKITSQAPDGGFLAPLNITPLADGFLYSATSAPAAMTVDSSDNIYSFEYIDVTNACTIVVQSLYSGEKTLGVFDKIAGGNQSCGFSGDGGEARNAEIGDYVGQMAFDIAGNLYFSDSANQRVRRIDASTGIINTIAGNGTAGYTGDGGAATAAELSSPTGVGVDSQGQVYILSSDAATGTSQVIRKVGPNGVLTFASQNKGTASAAKLLTLSNTGNSDLNLTRAVFTGTTAADFSIDADTTSCDLTPGATLYAGQSCKVGIIFDPQGGGPRNANLVFLDNTVTNSNTVQLSGGGMLPAPTLTITAPAAGSSFKSGTAVTFSVKVTSAASPAPTGTVKFLVGGATFGSPVALNSGAASISLTGLSVAKHTISAVYSGDVNYAAVGPVSETVTITSTAAIPTAVKLTAKVNPANSCQPVPFSVTVDRKTGALPAGKVELIEDAKVVASGIVEGGKATITVPKLSAGAHMLVAYYMGAGDDEPAKSVEVKEVVTTASCAAK